MGPTRGAGLISPYQPSFPSFSSPSSNASLVKKLKCTTFKLKMMPRSQYVSNVAISTSPSKLKLLGGDKKIQQVESIKEFDELLASSSHNELTLVAFAPNHDYYTRKILHFLRELSKTSNNNARFLYVVGDHGSRSSEELCERENFTSKVPTFRFYKGMQKIHQVEGLEFDQLACDVLYYSENYDNVVQLYKKDDFDKLIRDGKCNDHRLLVVLIGLKHCGPCARVYPTLLQMSRMDSTTAVFARMDGDENDSCKEFLKEMNVVEVPTFLFAKNGEICGRYVGSNRSNLIKEVAKYKRNLFLS